MPYLNVICKISVSHKYDIRWLTEKFDSGESLKFLFFWGHSNNSSSITKSCLSQWYGSNFTIEGIEYKTAEHWMMSQKALAFDNLNIHDQIINIESPDAAKKLGRNVLGFNGAVWDSIKYNLVVLGNIHKFNQNRELGDFLLRTGTRILVESSPTDNIWGIGLHQNEPNIENVYTWNGLNLLGFALMEARDFLMDFGYFENLKLKLETPWQRFPNVDPFDLFWRMGIGEDFINKFFEQFRTLGLRDQTIFKLTHPAPTSWLEFYGKE